MKNSKVDGRGGLKEEGVSSPEKEGDIREGANRGFTVICFSIKHLAKIKLQFTEGKTQFERPPPNKCPLLKQKFLTSAWVLF